MLIYSMSLIENEALFRCFHNEDSVLVHHVKLFLSTQILHQLALFGPACIASDVAPENIPRTERKMVQVLSTKYSFEGLGWRSRTMTCTEEAMFGG